MNKITHNGIIQSIENDCINVRIFQSAACGSCKIAGHCNASDQKEKIISIEHCNIADYHIGDSVVVYTKSSTAHRAVFIGYGIPFILLVVTLFIIKAFTGSDAVAALGSIVALIPYYFVIFLLRAKIQNLVNFKIEKQKDPLP
jgi:sigma-E factor negative regulatory protein RseC